MTLGILV